MDEQLRGLSRGAGDPEQEARYLRSALRAGELERGEVELAAHLGDAAAQRALDQGPPPPELHRWIAGFRRFGQARFVRMLCAALRAATPEEGERRQALERILEVCEAWAREPTSAHQAAVEAVIAEQLTPTVQETVALRQNPASWQVVAAAQTAALNTRPGWEPDVAIPVRVDPSAPEAAEILAKFTKAGACMEWATRDGHTLAVIADCGFLGAGGIAKALAALSPLAPLEILPLARPFRERAAPALFAARLAGEATVRAAIEAALAPDLSLGEE